MMNRMTTALLAAGLALSSAPMAAHVHEPDTEAAGDVKEPSGAEVADMMRAMFKVEPLTAEQTARLPQARAVIERMMPPGTLQQMMGGLFDKFMGPLMEMGGKVSSADIAAELGVTDEDFELSDDDATRVAAIIDPARKERQELEAKAMQDGMSALMTAMEPSMRKGMAEAYAATFTSAELTDIDRFFATPSGASFARKSYALASDPRIMAAAMEGFPQMMAGMKDMEAKSKAATAALPPRKGYGDLTAGQRAEISRLTGIKPAALREGMERAAAERADKEATDDGGDFEGEEPAES